MKRTVIAGLVLAGAVGVGFDVSPAHASTTVVGGYTYNVYGDCNVLASLPLREQHKLCEITDHPGATATTVDDDDDNGASYYAPSIIQPNSMWPDGAVNYNGCAIDANTVNYYVSFGEESTLAGFCAWNSANYGGSFAWTTTNTDGVLTFTQGFLVSCNPIFGCVVEP